MKSAFIFIGAASIALLAACFLIGVNSDPGEVTVIREFTFPWSDKPAPRTEFRVSLTNEHLDFQFHVEDRDIVVSEKWTGESTLDGEDRVEIFFTPHDDLSQYYCLEIDPLGRVHDYSAKHYRLFDTSWNCPGLVVSAQWTAEGYSVKGQLPLAALEQIVGSSIRSGSDIRVGLFRAEFYGKEPATHGEAPDNWISWVKPESPTPDFHIPSAFRSLRLP